MKLERATFGAGCFWGVEARFQAIPGVAETAVGYAGGSRELPSYQDVCSGRTGHAEVVEVVFDPDRVCYSDLLDAFFAMHNPTQPYLQSGSTNRTRDRSQYRSVIFTHTPEQEAEAKAHIAALETSGQFSASLVTQMEPAAKFWRAEEYHQGYLSRRQPA